MTFSHEHFRFVFGLLERERERERERKWGREKEESNKAMGQVESNPMTFFHINTIFF